MSTAFTQHDFSGRVDFATTEALHPSTLLALLEQHPEGVILFDAEFRILFANAAARHISRVTPDLIGTKTHWEIYPQTIGTVMETVYRRVQQTRVAETLPDFYYPPFDVWVRVRAVPLGTGFAVYYSDVTTEHSLQTEREAIADRLALALDAAKGVGLWDWDIVHDLVFADAKFARLYGVPVETAAAGTPLANFFRNIHPEDQGPLRQRIDRYLLTGGEFYSEYRILQADGSIRWVGARGRIVLDTNGRAVRFSGLVIDVTEQRHRDELLRQNEERLRLALSAGGGLGTYDWDVLNDQVHADARFAELYGLSKEELVAGISRDALARNIHPEDLAAMDEAVRQVLNRGGDFFMEYRVQLPDAPLRWLSVRGRVTLDPQGRATRFSGIVTDITERKKAENALIQAEKLAAVGRLASSIAHEINNPLEAVTNLLFLTRQYTDAPEAKQFLSLAEQELRRVSVIANQTLRFHKQATRPTPCRPADLFNSALSLYEGRLRNSQITVVRRFRDSTPLECFEGDIRQVLLNLIGNAVDAMPLGGHLCLRSAKSIDWTTGRTGVRLTVADSGAGIARDALPRILEPFFTTKGFNGTGLGLWITSDIVQRHHGRLAVRSSQQSGRTGTVFTVFLPFGTPPTSAEKGIPEQPAR